MRCLLRAVRAQGRVQGAAPVGSSVATRPCTVMHIATRYGVAFIPPPAPQANSSALVEPHPHESPGFPRPLTSRESSVDLTSITPQLDP